jgi:hypothetical protein
MCPRLIDQHDFRATEGLPMQSSPSVPSVRVLIPYLIWVNLPYWVRVRTVHYCSTLNANVDGLIFHFAPQELHKLKLHIGMDHPQHVRHFREEFTHRDHRSYTAPVCHSWLQCDSVPADEE